MADATWPISLPAPLVRELEETQAELAVRSSIDSPVANGRQRADDGPSMFTVELVVTGDQLATFREFFDETLAHGCLPFTFVHPRTGNAADFRVLETPTYNALAPRLEGRGKWTVGFSIELLPGTEVIEEPDPPPPPPPPPIPQVYDHVAPGIDGENQPAPVDPGHEDPFQSSWPGPVAGIALEEPAPTPEFLPDLVAGVVPEEPTGDPGEAPTVEVVLLVADAPPPPQPYSTGLPPAVPQ